VVRITRAIEFSSSLRYWREDLSDEENRNRFGDAARIHGHNYRLELSLCGEPDPVTGMVMDLKEVKEVLEREVMARFDHRDLNGDTTFFKDRVPTPENFAQVLWLLLVEAFPTGMVDRIRLYQSSDLWVDVVGEVGSS